MPPAPPAEPPRRRDLPTNRAALVGLGALVGGAWGGLMWLLTTLMGQESGLRGLLYLVVTIAMIGGGVAAFFGATGAQRRNERVGPSLRRRRK